MDVCRGQIPDKCLRRELKKYTAEKVFFFPIKSIFKIEIESEHYASSASVKGQQTHQGVVGKGLVPDAPDENVGRPVGGAVEAF